MYAGRIVETGPVRDDLRDRRSIPIRPGLLASMPRLDETDGARLATIPGQPPNLQRLPPGCAFSDRCPYVFDRCRGERPPLRRHSRPGG